MCGLVRRGRSLNLWKRTDYRRQVASSRMGDHPGFLATYPCHTYTNTCNNPTNLKANTQK